MKKIAIVAISILVVGGLGYGTYTLLSSSDSDSNESQANQTTSELAKETAPNTKSTKSTVSNTASSAGRYTAYSESDLSTEGYDTNVVFFYAPWCPECRAFKGAINSSQIPAGVQILETDYDSSTELKSKYGVTLQSTFVKVDDSGGLQKKWVGYGKDKSLATVLSNLE